ncbi:MAG: hypothetical protein ACFCU8_17175 [Thermosynechococcaceae cyanobacterium]
MKTALFVLTPLVMGLTVMPPAPAQVLFGQPTSGQAIPFNALFVPTTSSSFFPPTGFYHYFWLPQYSTAYGRLYTDFEYSLPPGEVTYEFTVIQSFQY